MSTQDLTALEAHEIETVKQLLRGLVDTLQGKRAAAGGSLIPDEDGVLQALTHPERGDVVVTVLRSGGAIEVFIYNKRDPNTPFAVMDCGQLTRHPDRRTVDGSRPEAKEGRVALFLSSVNDQQMYAEAALSRVDTYAVHFQLYAPSGAQAPPPTAAEDLKTKPIASCTTAEKWTIYKRDWDYDARRSAIEQELFSFPVNYAKHRASASDEQILFPPGKFGSNLGQLVRDIYPTGVRQSLRRDYPAEHKAKLGEVHAVLDALKSTIRERIGSGNGDEYNAYLEELAGVIDELQATDPDLTRI